MAIKRRIEKNLQPPANRKNWQALAQALEEGDSVLVNTQAEATALKRCLAQYGYATQQAKDGKQLRVWKLEAFEEGERGE